VIVYPEFWMNIGRRITNEKIEEILLQVLSEMDCNCLSLSGGLDSSLMLYFLNQVHKKIFTFTIGLSEQHPDVKYSRLMSSQLPGIIHRVFIPGKKEIEAIDKSGDPFGNAIVRLFYQLVEQFTNKIITCDGINEFACGYYDHQRNPNEKTYYHYLRRLQRDHLIPLDKNSGNVRVYLPYLDNRMVSLYTQMPIRDKVDDENRKKFLIEIARGRVPTEILRRRKYGFSDALKIKKEVNCK